jgi:hypothetical protein
MLNVGIIERDDENSGCKDEEGRNIVPRPSIARCDFNGRLSSMVCAQLVQNSELDALNNISTSIVWFFEQWLAIQRLKYCEQSLWSDRRDALSVG